jgi:hypothetical protein
MGENGNRIDFADVRMAAATASRLERLQCLRAVLSKKRHHLPHDDPYNEAVECAADAIRCLPVIGG